MQLTLPIHIKPLGNPICYEQKILLIGSCFTEHISERLRQHKFEILSNPNGILFNPFSVADALKSYATKRIYEEEDLFYLNELWNSWDHHTRFSHTDRQEALAQINHSQSVSGSFIETAEWIIITLGSAFQYYLREGNRPVANNHRAPSQWFEKKLLNIQSVAEQLSASIFTIRNINPQVKFLFTISPVRHIRDGVVENNRSKARLIEVVHHLCETISEVYYFPAYELVIDVLRDYRFYDVDLVHPNYPATQMVWEYFCANCINPASRKLMEEIQEITTARAHKPRFPNTHAHLTFKQKYAAKTEALIKKNPWINLDEELLFFMT
ncbi:MAG: GSCFA domain-containing protein [Bacteroidetes bacterium]|nr:GSCFA domain-containing protein [Bacteroidota bacterium]